MAPEEDTQIQSHPKEWAFVSSPLLAMKQRALPPCPSVAALLRPLDPEHVRTSCQEALLRFHAEIDLFSLPVVDECGRPVAIIDRHQFIEFFSRPFTKEVFGKRTLKDILDERRDSMIGVFPIAAPIVVDVATTVDDVARIIIDTGIQHMVNGVVITEFGRYAGVVFGHDLLHEITERKQAELHFLAHYDALTKIPNRMLFSDRLNQACLEATRHERQVALLFIDLDRFKQINDSLGHSVGDALLVAIAANLKACVRDCDTVARLGGDEFAIVMESVHGPEDANTLAQRLIASIQQPLRILDREISVSFSIGIAIYPRDDRQVDTLLSKADAAMYEAKVNGRNGYRQFSATTTTFSSERSTLEADLKLALANDQFVLVYQPLFQLEGEQVAGLEALIRWDHPHRGRISPGSFIGIAEESGLIVAIGDWVIAEACRQHRAWTDQGLPSMRLALNISPLQLRQPDFVERVSRILDENQIDPDCIEFELTENAVMHQAPQVLAMLSELRSMGAHFSLDDFGTGFSNLGYLNRYPIERLKIDQSFVRSIDQMPINQSIVRSIVALAKSLSLQIVAEGVETEAELAWLRTFQFDEVQGYLLARPMPAQIVAEWFQDRLGC